MELSPEQRKERLEKVLKVVMLLIVGFVVAPFIFVAIKGLIGLAVAAVVGVLLSQFAPVLAALIANWRLKAIKAEAARNPIETLQNDYGRRVEALQQFKEAIESFSTEVYTFSDKLAGFKAQYPDEADRYDDALSKMKQLLTLRAKKYKEAKANLVDYDEEIKKAKAIWEMGLAAAKMNKAAGVGNDDFLAKIMKDTALDSVQRSMNSAFADLEISLLDEDASTAKKMYKAKYNGGAVPAASKAELLPASPKTPQITFDVHPLDVKELVTAGRR